MKIGIVTTWFERGAAYVSKQYADTLKDANEVFIYARGGEEYAIEDPKWDKDNVYWGKRVLSPIPTYIDKKDFIKWLKKNNIELVIFNEQRWWEPVFVCNKMGIKTVAYIDYYTEETIPFFASYDALICNTKRHLEAFKWHEQVIYIPWGTSINIFVPMHTKTPNKIKFFHSCGMSPNRKGTELVLKAFNKLYSDNPNCSLIIHSQMKLEKAIPDCINIISDLKNKNILEVIEETVPAPGLYFKGDVYVYPTLLEGIGLTIAEAISSGLPTIVPDAPPMNEFVKDEVSGKVVAIHRLFSRSDGYYWPQNLCDIDDLKNKMEFYVDNRDEMLTFKNNARKYAEKHLDWIENSKDLNNRLASLKYSKKSNQIELEIKKYFQKRIPGIYKLHLLYRTLYAFYKKIN